MSIDITIPGGEKRRLLTGGKYCPEDILVEAEAGGVELPELENPAAESEIFLGRETIGEDGSIKTGTFTIDAELTEQDSLIRELQTELSGKAAGGTAGQYVEGTISIDAEVETLDIALGFEPDLFVATVTNLTATSGMKTLMWVKTDIVVLTDIQNVGTGAHSFKVEDYTASLDGGITVKRFGSYNIPVGTLQYRAYKK